jgi:hypothetical protein
MELADTLSVLGTVRDLVMGRRTGSRAERGWTQGAYDSRDRDTIRNCLNGALRVAERDLGLRNPASYQNPLSYDAPMDSEVGKGAQRLLAEACAELKPSAMSGVLGAREIWDADLETVTVDVSRIDFSDPATCHNVIVAYNDNEGQTQTQMDEALELAEKKSFQQWLDQHPRWQPTSDDAAVKNFIDSIVIQ